MTGVGLKELDETLRGELSRWKAWRVSFPTSWFAIKERLAGMAESYLSFDQFRQICCELAGIRLRRSRRNWPDTCTSSASL